MILTNFLVGLVAMLVCLAIQAFVAFWCVRYFVRQIRRVKPKPEDCSRPVSGRCWWRWSR